MREDSEESRLIGNPSKPNMMAYTDGPKIPIDEEEGGTIPVTAPPPYEKVAGRLDCNCENTWRNHFSDPPKLTSQTINDLMGCSGVHLLTQFHADALKQVGFGKFHFLMIFACGLALGAQIGQIFSLFFILPSADMEFCMIPHQKDLLTIISLLGAAFGALNCGAIAEINGRKRTLLSCVICMTLFSVVSAFMPTFGPFAMARFCAAACGGGIFPVAAVYIGEMVPAALRARCIGAFTSIGLIGGTIAAAVSIFMLPMTGEQLLLEHKDHFRSWHRYLLFMTLSSVLPIFGLCSLPESPRWLLSSGREVEALETYQAIYTRNHMGERYNISELQLPTTLNERVRTPHSVLNVMTHNALQFMDGFGTLLRPPYKKTTLILMAIWFGAMFITFGLTLYVLKFGRLEFEQNFLSRMFMTSNYTYENISFTANLINQQFTDTRFLNCTFEQILLSYVQFKNCTFLDTNFHGVKTANTTFMDSILNNVKFIDTDITKEDFSNCVRNNTEFDRMVGGCDRQFNFSLFNEVGYHAHLGWIVPTLVIVVWASCAVNRLGRVRTSTFALTLATMVCCLVGLACHGEVIYWIVGVIQGLVIGALIAVSVQTIEFYNVFQRCTALGMCVCCAHFGAVVGLRVYSELPMGDTHIAAVMSIAGLSFPSILTTFLRENPCAL